MITIAIFNQMAQDQTLNLTPNKDFYYEELPLQKNGKPSTGVWLVTRGGSAFATPKGHNLKQTIDFYIADDNKANADKKLEAISAWLRANRCICALSGSAGGNLYSFRNIRIVPATTPLNNGHTDNGMIVKTLSANVVYDLDDTNN